MSPAEFRDAAARSTEWAAHYLETVEQRPVGHAVVPGLVRSALPADLPAEGASFDVMLRDVDRRFHGPNRRRPYPGGLILLVLLSA